MDVWGRDHELEVRVTHRFKARHSLPMRPELHDHEWEAEFSVSGPINPETGMVCDMLTLSEFFEPYVAALDGCTLHDFPGFHGHAGLVGLAAKFPTCDTLAHYFLWRTLPDFNKRPAFAGLRISQIKVSVWDPQGEESWGSALIRSKER